VTTLLDRLKPDKSTSPHLHHLTPPAAMPGGEIELHGANLGPHHESLPSVTIGDTHAAISLARSTRTLVRIPEGCISGDLVLHRNGAASNPIHARIAVPMAENLHPVANPAVDSEGRVFATFSGSRGQEVPVSIFAIERDFQIRPFARDLLNPTGLAFGRDGFLYVSSRADGIVYRISPEGHRWIYAEGLGIATGIAFDPAGNLYVGDRSGTIFKIAAPQSSGLPSHNSEGPADPRNIFVFATLEPSMAAYHLAFNAHGTLFVTGPTTSSNQAIHAIAPDGTTTVFYQGLGRAQGMAFDIEDNLYVAASLHGHRGIVRITPDHQATIAVSGSNLVGLAFLEDGCAALATRDALYHLDLGIEGRKLV
jgi:hypothetical protein